MDDPVARDAVLRRLRRVEGQVRGVARMVDEDRYCVDVLTQVAAASRALQGVALALLNDHLATCLIEAPRAGPLEQGSRVDEVSAAIARLVRS